jgi:orotidine-5'-phosphate decarboxylase
VFKGIKSPIFVALDVDDKDRALDIARQVEPFVGGFKIGPRLCIKYGAELVTELASMGHVFVDNKYFDIPNTMEFAVRATFEAGATFATIHAQAGREALTRLASVERELNRQRPFRLLCVTILTSFNQAGLPPTANTRPISEQVDLLADLAIDCGLSGLVCSPHEVQPLKSRHPAAFVVTPGIRLAEGNEGDQKRTMGPREALAAGATALVVGRPIVDASNPAAAAEEYFNEARV